MSARAAAASTKVRLGPGAATFPSRSGPAVPPVRFSHCPAESAPRWPRLYPHPVLRARASADRGGGRGGQEPPGRLPPRASLLPAGKGAQVARTPLARAAAPPAAPAPPGRPPVGRAGPGPGPGTAAAAGPCPREKPPRSRRCAGRALLFQAGAG